MLDQHQCFSRFTKLAIVKKGPDRLRSDRFGPFLTKRPVHTCQVIVCHATQSVCSALSASDRPFGLAAFLNQLFKTNPTQPELAFYLIGKFGLEHSRFWSFFGARAIQRPGFRNKGVGFVLKS
eukprot:sb/3475858/